MKEKIVVFGFGRQGKKEIRALKRAFEIVAIVDNDKKKTGISYKGIPVIHAGEAEEVLKRYRIVITAQASFYKEIKAQLERLGIGGANSLTHSFLFRNGFMKTGMRRTYTSWI